MPRYRVVASIVYEVTVVATSRQAAEDDALATPFHLWDMLPEVDVEIEAEIKEDTDA